MIKACTSDRLKTTITTIGISVRNLPKTPGSCVRGQNATIVVSAEKTTGIAIL